MKFVWAAIIISLIASTPYAADNKPVVTPVLTTEVTATGQPFSFPTKNAQIVVATYEIPEGAALPEHKHPYPRFGYMLAGTLRVTNTETGKSEVYNAGDFIPDAIDQWHQGATVGAGTAKLLVIDMTEKGHSNVTPKH